MSNMANYNKLFSAVLQQVNVSTDQVISKRAKLVSNLRRKNNLSGTTNQDADKEGQMARRGMKYFIPQATRSRLLVVKDEARPSGSTPSALQELTARRMNSCRLTGPKDVDAQGAAEKRRLRDALRKSAITQGKHSMSHLSAPVFHLCSSGPSYFHLLLALSSGLPMPYTAILISFFLCRS